MDGWMQCMHRHLFSHPHTNNTTQSNMPAGFDAVRDVMSRPSSNSDSSTSFVRETCSSTPPPIQRPGRSASIADMLNEAPKRTISKASPSLANILNPPASPEQSPSRSRPTFQGDFIMPDLPRPHRSPEMRRGGLPASSTTFAYRTGERETSAPSTPGGDRTPLTPGGLTPSAQLVERSVFAWPPPSSREEQHSITLPPPPPLPHPLLHHHHPHHSPPSFSSPSPAPTTHHPQTALPTLLSRPPPQVLITQQEYAREIHFRELQAAHEQERLQREREREVEVEWERHRTMQHHHQRTSLEYEHWQRQRERALLLDHAQEEREHARRTSVGGAETSASIISLPRKRSINERQRDEEEFSPFVKPTPHHQYVQQEEQLPPAKKQITSTNADAIMTPKEKRAATAAARRKSTAQAQAIAAAAAQAEVQVEAQPTEKEKLSKARPKAKPKARGVKAKLREVEGAQVQEGQAASLVKPASPPTHPISAAAAVAATAPPTATADVEMQVEATTYARRASPSSFPELAAPLAEEAAATSKDTKRQRKASSPSPSSEAHVQAHAEQHEKAQRRPSPAAKVTKKETEAEAATSAAAVPAEQQQERETDVHMEDIWVGSNPTSRRDETSTLQQPRSHSQAAAAAASEQDERKMDQASVLQAPSAPHLPKPLPLETPSVLQASHSTSSLPLTPAPASGQSKAAALTKAVPARRPSVLEPAPARSRDPVGAALEARRSASPPPLRRYAPTRVTPPGLVRRPLSLAELKQRQGMSQNPLRLAWSIQHPGQSDGWHEMLRAFGNQTGTAATAAAAQSSRLDRDARDSQATSTATAAALVASHYNARPDAGLGAREQSPILPLRKFNNWIKSVLINHFAHKAGRTLDLGAGKGGDLMKWAAVGTRELVLVDIADQSIEQARHRYEEKRQPFRADFFAFDAFGSPLAEHIPAHILAPQFDNVTLQFCMHYAWERSSKALLMLENVSRYLKPGGIFIGTIPDAERLRSELRALPGDELAFGNDVYQVHFDPAQLDKKHSCPHFGHKYTFWLKDAIDECDEYVVDFDQLESLAMQMGLKLLYRKTFEEVWKHLGRMPDHARLARQMGVAHPDNVDIPMNLSLWQAASIYLCFAFQKI